MRLILLYREIGIRISLGRLYSKVIWSTRLLPDAWVKDDSDIKTIARKKGFHVGKDDGMVKVTVPIDQRIQSNRQLLEKPRYTKPTVKHRRGIERMRKMK